MRIANPFALLAVAAALPAFTMADDVKVEYHGAGWLQMGKVQESWNNPNKPPLNNYEKTWMQNAGAVFEANVGINESWDGKLGLGTINVHLSRGQTANANIWYPFWVPFITEARITHTNNFAEDHSLKLTFGSFGVNYNPDVKNLGMYLMHGYVYPGTLVSGYTGPLGVLAATTGAMASYRYGTLQNDLVFISETDDKPLYDVSIADIFTIRPTAGLEFGFGVNFYRALAQNKRLTSPDKSCIASSELGEYSRGCFEVDSIGVDLTGNTVYDTTTGSLAGTKLMGRFHVDPKALLGIQGIFGPADLILYGEAAVLGVKNVGKYYNDIKQRIPVMVGLNLPGFGFLNWSIEGEYYATKNSEDNLSAQFGSWVPIKDQGVDYGRDDWKWSLNASKVMAGHIMLAAQVANDHLRLGGYHNYATGLETTTTPKDWYWTTKAVYFF